MHIRVYKLFSNKILCGVYSILSGVLIKKTKRDNREETLLLWWALFVLLAFALRATPPVALSRGTVEHKGPKGRWRLAQGTRGSCAWVLGSKENGLDRGSGEEAGAMLKCLAGVRGSDGGIGQKRREEWGENRRNRFLAKKKKNYGFFCFKICLFLGRGDKRRVGGVG